MVKLGTGSSQSLVTLGLSEHESTVYQVLLAEGSLSAKEIAKNTDMLPPAAYRLLTLLTEKGLASSIGSYPKVYHAIPPSIALDVFAKRKIVEIETLKSQAVSELTRTSKKTQPTQVNVLTDQREIMTTFAHVAKEARKEILIVSIGEPILEEAILAVRDALEKEVHVKMIAHKYDHENRALLQSWVKMGWEIRHYPDSGFHVVIIDGKRSLLAVNNPKDVRERIGIQFFSEGLSKGFRDYFYSVWAKAKDI